MNINTNSKYYKMHTDVLNVCEQHGVKIMPGKKVAYEMLHNIGIIGLKEFLLTPEDMEVFMDLCRPELERQGYLIEGIKLKGDTVCRVYNPEILATSIHALMNKPSGKHCAQFILRQLTKENGGYSTGSGITAPIGTDVIDQLEAASYKDSYVYINGNIENYIRSVFGDKFEEDNIASGYAIFSEDCNPEEFVKEAKKRGYISVDRALKHKKYRLWRKEKRNPIEEMYRKYQDILLGLKRD